MTFKYERKDHGSINDNTVKNLLAGSHNYRIQGCSLEPVKSDKTKKRKHLKLEFRHTSGQSYIYFIELNKRPISPKATDKKKARDNEETRVRIANETFGAILDATGFPEDVTMTAAKLKTLVGKDIGIRCEATKNGNQEYINIREIQEPFDLDDEEDDLPEDYEEDIEEEEGIEVEEEEEIEEVPKTKKKRRSIKKPSTVEVKEEDDDDDDDEPF